MAETLYQRLGGAERIASIIDNALDRHAVNEVLAPRFRGKDLAKLKKLGTQFFCSGIGGPCDDIILLIYHRDCQVPNGVRTDRLVICKGDYVANSNIAALAEISIEKVAP